MELPDSVRDALESRPNVIGTCIGTRRVDGRPTGEETVVVLVSRKLPDEQLSADEHIPETVEIDGKEVQTDVQEVGEPRMLSGVSAGVAESQQDRTRRWRPAPAGVSIGHPEITAGTLGTTVLLDDEGRAVVLTNAHVAAPIGVAAPGDPVYQPGPADGGTEEDVIGELSEYSEISRDEPNTTDSALIAVDQESIAEEILGIGPFVGIEKSPDMDTTYTKSGRTTGVTTGNQRGRDARIRVRGYYEEPVVFEGIAVFDPMGTGGDSGSVIGIERGNGFHATHLLFAGSDRVTLAVPMAAVEAEHGSFRPAPVTESQPPFRGRVERALTNGYGPTAVTDHGSESGTGPDFRVTTPFVRFVVVVAEQTSQVFDAAGRALAHSTHETEVPVVVCPDAEIEDDFESLGAHVCLVRL